MLTLNNQSKVTNDSLIHRGQHRQFTADFFRPSRESPHHYQGIMPDDDVHVNMLFHLSLTEALIIIGLQLLKLEFDTA